MSRDFNPYINYKIIVKCLNVSDRTAKDIIRVINKQIESNKKKAVRGNVPASEFENLYPINRTTVLYYWRQSELNYGQEKDYEKGVY